MKTAVDYIKEKLMCNEYWYENMTFDQIIDQAKEMEKEQIGKAFLNGRIKEIGQCVLFDLQPLKETFDNYYNETYESNT